MAHIMLPGTSTVKNQLHATRYTANTIEEILCHLKMFGIKKENIEICIAGGANVLKREKDNFGKDNPDAFKKLLWEKQIEIKAKAIGGFYRRSVIFDIDLGCIYYTVGDTSVH